MFVCLFVVVLFLLLFVFEFAAVSLATSLQLFSTYLS